MGNFKVSIYLPLKEHGVVFFISIDNANTFCRFFSNLADSLLQAFPSLKNMFGIKTTEEHYKQIQNECEDLNLHNAM